MGDELDDPNDAVECDADALEGGGTLSKRSKKSQRGGGSQGGIGIADPSSMPEESPNKRRKKEPSSDGIKAEDVLFGRRVAKAFDGKLHRGESIHFAVFCHGPNHLLACFLLIPIAL